MKEVTSSGSSVVHFGHMKACSLSLPLSNFEATVSHVPYCTGYSPEEWKESVNTMIEKKGKGNKVGDLRTINLMEAGFNFNNKTMTRDILYCAERNDLLPKEQCGSRHGHCASKQASNKRLLFDLAHLLRRPLGVCSTDAKSCYDRILHSFASLAL